MDASFKDISADPDLVLAVKELADRLGLDLDEVTLKVLLELLELGMQPEPLARAIRELEMQKLTQQASDRKGASVKQHGVKN